jgi:putative ubiquitin-RnfH superfamily antitoxin RatB of RatAB toxin-antitoxin module
MAGESASVEVVYAQLQEQAVVQVAWRPGLTAEQAVLDSGLLAQYPDAAHTPLVLGRFGARIDHDALLQPGDRVEICRPLHADPRDSRRTRVQQGRFVGLKTRD